MSALACRIARLERERPPPLSFEHLSDEELEALLADASQQMAEGMQAMLEEIDSGRADPEALDGDPLFDDLGRFFRSDLVQAGCSTAGLTRIDLVRAWLELAGRQPRALVQPSR